MLKEACHHNDALAVVVPHHPPKIRNGLHVWPLSCNVFLGLCFTLKQQQEEEEGVNFPRPLIVTKTMQNDLNPLMRIKALNRSHSVSLFHQSKQLSA